MLAAAVGRFRGGFVNVLLPNRPRRRIGRGIAHDRRNRTSSINAGDGREQPTVADHRRPFPDGRGVGFHLRGGQRPNFMEPVFGRRPIGSPLQANQRGDNLAMSGSHFGRPEPGVYSVAVHRQGVTAPAGERQLFIGVRRADAGQRILAGQTAGRQIVCQDMAIIGDKGLSACDYWVETQCRGAHQRPLDGQVLRAPGSGIAG